MGRRHDRDRYASKEWLRTHFAEICRRRGVPNYFDRFEPGEVYSDGIKLHLDIIEVDQQLPTLVFMPGTNAYAMLYGDFLTAVADRGHNIVGFDPRGHGRSGGRRGSYTVSELLADMRSVVEYARDRFGIPIVVSGSSQGGITAFYFAASEVGLAGAICHNAADLGDPDSARLTRFPKLGRWMGSSLTAFARLIPELPVPMTLYIDLKVEPVRNMGSAKDILYWDPLLVPYVRLKTLASLGTERLPRAVEQIETPIMILQAGEDTIFPTDYIERLYERLNCKKSLKKYAGLPHYMIVDHVDEILDDVVEWIKDVCREGVCSEDGGRG